jgi:hypothetical protein
MNDTLPHCPPLRRDLALAVLLIALGVLGRWNDHAPNATPLAAIALFAGYAIPRRRLALAVPVLALAISDVLFAGGYDPRVMFIVYGTLAANAIVGRWLVGRWHAVRVGGATLLAPTLFFLTTNLAVWQAGSGYAPTWAGLLHCYANGLPFLANNLQGDVFWCSVVFGGAAVLDWAAAAVRARPREPAGGRRCRPVAD